MKQTIQRDRRYRFVMGFNKYDTLNKIQSLTTPQFTLSLTRLVSEIQTREIA